MMVRLGARDAQLAMKKEPAGSSVMGVPRRTTTGDVREVGAGERDRENCSSESPSSRTWTWRSTVAPSGLAAGNETAWATKAA